MRLQARTVQFSEPAFIAFLKLVPTPTPDDHTKIRNICDSVEDGKAEASEVMFEYPERSYLVLSAGWAVIMEDRAPIWFVTHIDRV